MNSFYQLEDIYYNYLSNYESLYLDKYIKQLYLNNRSYIKENNYYYGLIGDKVQFVCSNIANNTNNQFTLVFYQSPKYNRYQTVFLKQFSYHALYGFTYEKENPFISGIYIYGKQLLKNDYIIQSDPPGFNPEQLDVYYDTIYTLNEYKYYITDNYNDPIFYEKFGNAILPLSTLPIEKYYDKYYTNEDSFNLYNNNTHILKNDNFSIDSPELTTRNNVNISDKIYYSFDKLLYNYEYPNSLSTHHLYLGILNIYDYYNNSDIDEVEYDIITVNNEYSIIAGKILEYNSYNTTINYIDYNYSQEPDKINSDNTNQIVSSLYGKNIVFYNFTLENYRIALGDDIFYGLNSVFKLIDAKFEITNYGIPNKNEELNIGEYIDLIKITTELNALNLKNEIENSSNTIKNLYVDITSANILDTVCFRLLNKNVFFRPSSNSNFIIKLSEIDDELINGNVILSYPYYIKRSIPIYTYSKSDYTSTENYHYGQILSKKLKDSTISETNYIDMISKEEIYSIQNYDNLNDFEYELFIEDTINNNIISNNFVEENRFKIYGVSIDLDNSDSNYLNVSSYSSFLKYVNSGKIKLLPFPIPMLLDSNNRNICTNNTINDVNSFVGLNNINNIITNDSTAYIINDYKKIVYDRINTGSLTEYDKAVYNTYNKETFIFDFQELTLINKNNMTLIYMIYDTYTENFDIINLNDLLNVDYHVNKLKLSNENKYLRNNARFYDTDPVDKIIYVYGKLNLTSGYEITHKPIYYNKLEILNGNNITGEIDKLVLYCNVYNTDTYEITYTVYELELTDLTIVGDNLEYDITNLVNSNERIINSLNQRLYTKMEQKNFTYFNNLYVKFYTNFNNFVSISTVILTGIYYSDIINEVIKDVNIGLYNNNIDNIIPQLLYSKNISLSIFDINDDIQKYLPDNKKCIFFNNYIGNSINQQYIELTDSTIYDIEDISIVDKNNFAYNKFDNQNNILPYIINNNINKYIKIYAKLSINELSDFIETFEYDNLFNIDFISESKGVLIIDGKITDITDHTTIDDILKEYKINLTFTISNNINNSITIPIDVELTYELFNDYYNYQNNIIDNTISQDSVILMNVKSRGDYIESKVTYSPKLVEYIEYFDIYPEYSQQEEGIHNIELEINLTSSDSTIVKVSELYFDIFNCTDDLYIAIPDDYKNLENPEEELNNVTQSNYKYDILDYFNYLIRFRCNNCGIVTLKINVRNKPKYFGFNIASVMLGCYTHNIKLEQFVPYIFYKESANTVFIIDKKSSIEKEKQELTDVIKNNYQNNQDAHTLSYYDNFSNDYDKTNLVKYIDKPIKSKSTLLLFNSSFNNKKIIFSLKENNTPKTIINNYKEYNLAPLEFKILSLVENIDSTDYSNSYDSGIVFYDLIEHDLDTDITTIIDTVELPIPSLDDYVRSMLNFVDKMAKLVQVDFEQNQFYIDESNQSEKYKTEKFKSSTKISFINSSILSINNNNSLLDIDYLFYIDETYKIVIDRSDLDNIITQTSQFGDIIYIKIPILYPINQKYIINNIQNFSYNLENEITTLSINNLIDNDENYLYLIGRQTNIDQFTFTLKGIISVKNETLLSYILNNNFDITNFKTYGINLNFKIVDPSTILSLFFKDYGDNLAISVANEFIGKDKIIPVNSIELLSNLIDEFSIENSPKQNSITKNLSMIGKSNKYTLPTITYENVSNIFDTGVMEIYNNDLSGNYSSSYLFPSKKENIYDYDRFTDALKFYLNLFSENDSIPIQQTVNQDNQLFDDVNDILTSSNFLSDAFNSSGFFRVSLKLDINNGLRINHFISLSCDSNYDQIISASINSSIEGDNGYEFYYVGDDNIKFNDGDNYISIIYQNLKQNTMQLLIDNTKYSLNNSPYKLQNSLQRKVLENPLLIRTIDYSENPIIVISDSNYKMIFEIPVQLFKASQSYLTIDKIRVADNFINDTDYCIIFGDTNEIYNIKSNNEKLLNKTYYKYDKNNLKFLIRGFNVPNQIGEYYITLIIYYTFNGEQYSITKDIRYKVELIDVLDNEYLIAEVERLDYVKNPTETKTDNFGNIVEVDIGDSISDKSNNILTDVYKGTAGCDLSYPDLNWFKNG